ncbi:MAG TPA: hypothetical protein VHF22_06595, partial [Planctomycetota bacterium]|nr:hypothetical protein [Planctomycetota bacterium]
MDKRTILAIVLSMIVVAAWPVLLQKRGLVRPPAPGAAGTGPARVTGTAEPGGVTETAGGPTPAE